MLCSVSPDENDNNQYNHDERHQDAHSDDHSLVGGGALRLWLDLKLKTVTKHFD